MKTILALIISASLALSAFSAQIGDTVQSIVTTPNRVPIPSSFDPFPITNIVLEDGVWSISGQVNFLSLAQQIGILFTAGNISVLVPSFSPDGTSAVQAETISRAGNVIRPMALTPRIVEVSNNTTVYLVAGVFGPNTNASAWGFISATKVRNHVP
jgi:hypothetical protein